MKADANEIDEAIYSATGAGNGNIGGGFLGTKKVVPGQRAAENLRHRIGQFLDMLPGELTVSEIREAMGRE